MDTQQAMITWVRARHAVLTHLVSVVAVRVTYVRPGLIHGVVMAMAAKAAKAATLPGYGGFLAVFSSYLASL